jgi:hypothetical protein
MASPPPRLASLVCDAGEVLGISTDCSCYYDTAATRGGAVLGVLMDCYYNAAATRGGAVPGVSTDYLDDAAAALGGTVPGALVESYNNAAAAWGDTVLGASADCYYHTDAARGGALLVPGFQRPAGAPSRWDVDLPFTGLLLPSQGAGNSWRAVPDHGLPGDCSLHRSTTPHFLAKQIYSLFANQPPLREAKLCPITVPITSETVDQTFSP